MILAILLFLTFLSHIRSDEDICKMISSEGHDILAIGELTNSIMIITRNYLVINIGKSALNSSTHKFKLKGSKYKPIEVAFPKFKTNPHFQAIRNNIFSGRIHAYGSQQTIDLELIRAIHHKVGVRYDIPSGSFVKGRFYVGTTEYYFLLPKAQSRDFYGFVKPHDKTEYEVSYWHEINDIIYRMKVNILCKKKGSNTFYFQRSSGCEEHINWQDKRGFIANSFVYMFSKTDVSIFPESIIVGLRNGMASTEPFTPIVRHYGEFFDCSGDENVENVDYGAQAGSLWLLLLLIILILILIFCLCLGMMAMMRKRNQRDLSGRSGLMPNFGTLTRLMSSHKSMSRRSHINSNNDPCNKFGAAKPSSIIKSNRSKSRSRQGHPKSSRANNSAGSQSKPSRPYGGSKLSGDQKTYRSKNRSQNISKLSTKPSRSAPSKSRSNSRKSGNLCSNAKSVGTIRSKLKQSMKRAS